MRAEGEMSEGGVGVHTAIVLGLHDAECRGLGKREGEEKRREMNKTAGIYQVTGDTSI
jgi:hypothetical protein